MTVRVWELVDRDGHDSSRLVGEAAEADDAKRLAEDDHRLHHRVEPHHGLPPLPLSWHSLAPGLFTAPARGPWLWHCRYLLVQAAGPGTAEHRWALQDRQLPDDVDGFRSELAADIERLRGVLAHLERLHHDTDIPRPRET